MGILPARAATNATSPKAHVVVSFRIVGFENKRRPILSNRTLNVTFGIEQHSKIIVRVCEMRVQLYSGLKFLCCTVEIVRVGKCHAKSIVEIRHIGLEACTSAELTHRTFPLPSLGQDIS